MKRWTPVFVVIVLVISHVLGRPEPRPKKEKDSDNIVEASKKSSPNKKSQTKEKTSKNSKTTTSAPNEEEGSSRPLPKKLPCPSKSKAKKCKQDNECKYEYPGDCSAYIKCNENGVAIVEDCPMGLEWKDDQKICTFPLFSKCSQPGPD